nr:DUF4304 domain-containing protein [Cohnella hashimotonis]
MQQRFNDLIKRDIKPFLAERGFAKKSLNFSKSTDGLVYMLNFQKSGGNSADHVMFYVNCGIYSADLARLQSKEVLAAPQEPECHFRARIEELAGAVPKRFSITPDTNMDDLRDTLLKGLDEVLQFYDTMTGARSIVDYYVAGPYLHLGEESFELLLQAGDETAARRYLQALQEKHGTENRWTIFENKYRAIFNKYGVPYES